MANLKINSVTPESHNSNLDVQQINSFIANETELKVSVDFYTENKIKSIVVKVTGANTLSGSATNVSYVSPKKTNMITVNVGLLKSAGDNIATVIITDIYGKTIQDSVSFKSYDAKNKYITVQDSYIDDSVARDLIDGKYYMGRSRVGLKIKAVSSQDIKSLTVKIGSKTYDLNSYSNCWNDFSFTCPDVLDLAGDCKIIITGETTSGAKDTKTMNLYVNSKVAIPPVPTIKFEHRNPRRHRHFFFCEGERLYFTGSSPDIEDYQIIVAYSQCDTFKAFEKYESDNCYADADSDELSDRLEENLSEDVRYYIYKDFDEGEYARPICRYPHHKHGFRLYYIAPDHNAHESFFALQWFEHAEPGDAIFVYVRERKRISAITSSEPQYVYSDNYEYNAIPKSEMFPMCVLPPEPSQIQLYEQSRTDKKLIIEYLNPIYDLDLGKKNPVHLIDVCLIAKDKNGKVLNGSDMKKRDGRWGRSWVYYSDRQWHNIVPWRYAKDNNKERFTMEFDISKYGKDATIYVVAFYYPDFYRHPGIYSTSNILQNKSKDMNFDLLIEKPENNSTVNSPNPLIQVKMIPKITEEDAIEASIYSDINYCKRGHWHLHRHHWHTHPIWLHHWPRPHDHCFPHFREHEWCRHNSHYHVFNDCPHHRIEHHHHHKYCYHRHHPCWKIPEKTPTQEPANYNECSLFLSCGDKEINLGDINIDELDTSEKIFSWVQDDSDTFLKVGTNKISAYTYPYIYPEENNKNEFEIFEGHWHTRCHFICHPVMKHHPHHYLHCIVRPPHIYDWLDIERDIIKFKIPYRRLQPNHEYEFTFKSFVDQGFWYDPDKVFEVDQSDEDNDLICGAFLDMIVHHDSILKNVHYDKRHIIYRPCYHIRHHNHHRPCINHYKKEMIHTIKFRAPERPTDFPWDKFFDIVLKVRGAHKVRIWCCKLKDVTGKTEEDVMASKELDRSTRQHETSINVTYKGIPEFTMTMQELDYIDPMKAQQQMALRNYLLNVASECGITTVTPEWRNYGSNSHLMARDYNDIKDYCYNLFSAIAVKYPKTFVGDPELFKKIIPNVMNPGDKRGPNTYSDDRGKHYFKEWDDLVDAIRKQTWQEYVEPEEPIFIKCTGINIMPDSIPIPQKGKIGDTYRVDYEVFPSNCMEEVIWVMENTSFVNVNNAIMTRTVNNIENSVIVEKQQLDNFKAVFDDTTWSYAYSTKNYYVFSISDTYGNNGTANSYGYSVFISPTPIDVTNYDTLTFTAAPYSIEDGNGRFGLAKNPNSSRADKNLYIKGSESSSIFKTHTLNIKDLTGNYYLISELDLDYSSGYTCDTEIRIQDVKLSNDNSEVYLIKDGKLMSFSTKTVAPVNNETKVIAKCGAYSDSAIVNVTSDTTNNIEITAFKVDYMSILNKTATITLPENSGKTNRYIEVQVESSQDIKSVTIKVSGKNSQTIELGNSDKKGNYIGWAYLHLAGSDTWTVTAEDIYGNKGTATGKTTTKREEPDVYEPPTYTQPEKYPCTGLSAGGHISLKAGAISIGTNISGTIGYMYPSYSPSNCTDSPSATSSNSNVAQALCTNFRNGQITVRVAGMNPGSCTITIRMGSYSSSFSVTVTA